jgi:hypothetical protein
MQSRPESLSSRVFERPKVPSWLRNSRAPRQLKLDAESSEKAGNIRQVYLEGVAVTYVSDFIKIV